MASFTFTAFPAEGLKFLRSLKRNNNREWFQAHKSAYEETVKQPMERLVLALAEDFQTLAPEMVATPKASLYRIYRDTRFSRDKSPYKTHVAASFPRMGLDRHQGAGLYLHIAPAELFVGGGVYMPLPEDLNAIRRHIAENFEDFQAIVEGKAFRRQFGQLWGDELRRVPRGFPADHPAAAYLKFRQYLASRTLEPVAATSPGFYKTVVESFRGLMPLIRFLNEPVVREHRLRERQQALAKP
jgi:uncharacterized protein (TIGR02453 family)